MTSAVRPVDRPGTNVRGGASGASWRLLLPSLDLGRLAILGAPSAADRRAIAAAGGIVSVLRRSRIGSRWTARSTEHPGPGGRDRPGNGSVRTLIVLGERGTRLLRIPSIRRELARALASDAVVYVQRPDGERPGELDVLPGSVRDHLVIGTSGGDLRWAAPGADAAAVTAARSLGVDRGGGVRATARRIVRRVRRRFGPESTVAEIVSPSDVSGPPRYLREVAAGSGVNLEGRRWAMAIPGLYASNKAVFLLFPDRGDEPDAVIKVARVPSQNPRLEDEAAALRTLATTRWIEAGSAPREVFTGSHAGLWVLGETALAGDPFSRRTTAEPGCPVARNVVERLIDLATETAVTMDAVTLRARLDDLFVRYRDLYRPAPRRAAFLRAQIDAIGAAGVLPAVFQHGDPGTWNILADIDRSVRFLDWEAADAHGVPLWDLFYFLRSFGVTVSRARGVEDALAAFRRQFLEETDLSRIQTEAIRRAREAIDLPVALVEPLFHTCWMHRAVKQASRLPRWKLGWGHYHRLVSTTIDERTAPGLRPMFAGG